MRKILAFILLSVFMMLIISGCGFGGNENVDELTPASSVSLNEQSPELKDKTAVKLYFINEQGTKLAAETRYINKAEASKGTEALATAIVRELISGPAKGSLLQATIPKGTAVHSNVTIKDGVATVDFSKEFIDKHPGGKKKEQLTLYSVVNSLTELKDIKTVQFKIDGKVKKDFKGNYQIDVAYPRSAYLNTADTNDQRVIQTDGKAETKDTEKDSQDKKADVKTDTKTNDTTTKDKTGEQVKDNEEKDQKTNADIDVDSDGEPLE